MNGKSIKAIFVMVILVVTVLTSCQRREMLVMSDDVYINHKMNTDLGLRDSARIKTPELFRFYVYNSEGRAVTSDFISDKGGPVHMPAGTYDFLTYNFGTEYCIVSDIEDRDRAFVHTSEVESELARLFGGITEMKSKSKAANTKASKFMSSKQTVNDDPYSDYYNMPVVFQPDFLWRAVIQNKVVPYRSEGEKQLCISMEADPIIKVGYVRVDGITGRKNLAGVKMFLTNMAAEVKLFSGKPAPKAAVISFDASPAKDSELGIEAEFRSFGKLDVTAMSELYYEQMEARGMRMPSRNGGQDAPEGQLNNNEAARKYGRYNELYLLFTDTGGGQYLWVYDVTDQVQNPEQEHITIYIKDDIDIPEPEHGGGGFAPTLGEWSEVYVPIEL